mgnify:FL=1
MWWFIKKIEENDTEVTYSYGYESKELTGSFSVAKNFSLFNIFEYAKNDDSDSFRELFCQPLFSTLRNLGFVDSRLIAIG